MEASSIPRSIADVWAAIERKTDEISGRYIQISHITIIWLTYTGSCKMQFLHEILSVFRFMEASSIPRSIADVWAAIERKTDKISG